jgi:hypothetical protein
MTISTETNRAQANGNGTTTAFSFPYYFGAQSELQVYLTTSAGVRTLQTIATHYTISGTVTNGVYATGGTVTFVTAPPTGSKVTIVRDTPQTQDVAVDKLATFRSQAMQRAFDKRAAAEQDLQEQVGRAPKLKVDTTSTTPTFPEPSADKIVGWNAAGSDLENKTVASLGAVDMTPINASLPETPEKYGASTSGTAAANATAFALLEATVPGAEIDMRGRTYPITAVPTGARYWNGGGWDVSGTFTAAPLRPRKHPLDGYPMIDDPGAGMAKHTGPIWYDSNDNRLHEVYAVAYSHGPSEGQMVIYGQSDDYGQSVNGWRTLFAKSSEQVLAMAGGMTNNGNYHVIVFTEADSYHIKSTDQGETWTVSTISTPTYSHFGYGELIPWPASVGGNDDDGFIVFTYSSNRILQLRHAGGVWSEALFFNGQSTGTARAGAAANEIRIALSSGYNTSWFKSATLFEDCNVTITSGTGSGQTKRITSANLTTMTLTVASNWTTPPDATSVYSIEGPNEVAAVKVGSQYLIYARGARNVMVCKTSDPRTVGTWLDTSIPNRGEAVVGDPLSAYYRDGNVYLYRFVRENWGETRHEQQLVVYTQEAQSLLAVSGVFASPTPQTALILPARSLGMLFMANTPIGPVGVCRVGETVYPTSSTQAVSVQIMKILPAPAPAPISAAVPGRNLLKNGGFVDAFAQREWSGLTGKTEILPNVFTYHSGATMDIQIEDTPFTLARLLPPGLNRTIWIDSVDDPDDYSGIRWEMYGDDALRLMGDQEVTWTIYGRGPTPEKMRCVVLFNFGSGGSSEDFISTLAPLPIGTCDLWMATVRQIVPSVVDATVGTDPYITLAIDNFDSSTAWQATGICGVKLEFGPRSTPFDLPSASSDFVTPEEFGAAGDGIADDKQSILNAIDAATLRGVPVVMRATYYATRFEITDPVTILGFGTGRINVKCATNDYPGINILSDRVTLDGLTIDVDLDEALGSHDGANGTCITTGRYFYNGTHEDVKDVVLRNLKLTRSGLGGHAIAVMGKSSDILIENVVADGHVNAILAHWGAVAAAVGDSYTQAWHPHGITVRKLKARNCTRGLVLSSIYDCSFEDISGDVDVALQLLPGDELAVNASAAEQNNIGSNIRFKGLSFTDLDSTNPMIIYGLGTSQESPGTVRRFYWRGLSFEDVRLECASGATITSTVELEKIGGDVTFTNFEVIGSTDLAVNLTECDGNIVFDRLRTDARVVLSYCRGVSFRDPLLVGYSNASPKMTLDIRGRTWATTLGANVLAGATSLTLAAGGFGEEVQVGDEIYSGSKRYVATAYAASDATSISVEAAEEAATSGDAITLDKSARNISVKGGRISKGFANASVNYVGSTITSAAGQGIVFDGVEFEAGYRYGLIAYDAVVGVRDCVFEAGGRERLVSGAAATRDLYVGTSANVKAVNCIFGRYGGGLVEYNVGAASGAYRGIMRDCEFLGAVTGIVSDSGGKILVQRGLDSDSTPISRDASHSLTRYASTVYVVSPYLTLANPAGAALTADRLYMIPFPVSDPGVMTRIGINVTTGAAGKSARLGVYRVTQANRPGKLLLDAGTVDLTSTALVEATISLNLHPGWYWLALVADGTASISMSSTSSFFTPLGLSSSYLRVTHLYRAFTFGSLGSDESASSWTEPTGAATPIIHLRAA